MVLPYGNDQRFECEIDSDHLVGEHAAPRPNPLYKEELLAALRATIHSDYGQLEAEVGKYLVGKYGN